MRAFLRWKSTFLVLVFFYYFVACGIERIYQPMASTFGLCGPLNLSPRNVFKKQKKLCFFFYKISSPFSLYNSQESESNTYTKHLVYIIIYFFLMDSFSGVNVPSTLVSGRPPPPFIVDITFALVDRYLYWMDMKGGSGDGFFLQRRLHVRPYSLRHCRRLHPSEAKRTHKNWLNYFLYYVRNVRRCIKKFVLTRYFLIHSTLIQKALWFISVFVQCFPFTKKFFLWLKGFTPPPPNPL